MTANPALEFLLGRASTPARLLGAPVPSEDELSLVLDAAVRAPDHAGLKPWRFIRIEGEARERLGDLFAEATRRRDPETSAEKLEDLRAKPLRAPLILAVCAAIAEHPKVPPVEQVASAASAGHAMLLALQALGYGGVLLTGPNAHDPYVKARLGLSAGDEIVAFLYVGTPQGRQPAKPRPEGRAFLTAWDGPAA